VLLGYFTGLELLFGSLNILLFCLSLWITDSAKHILIVAGTFMYQISPGHAPAYPANSDYFFTGIRPYIMALLIIALISSFSAYVIRTKIYQTYNRKDCALLWPMLVLASAFLLNGIGSDKYTGKDFLLGFAEAFAYFAFFLLFYFGFRKKDLEDIEKYVCTCTLLIAATILFQLATLYLFDDVCREDGAINVYLIRLGWGVSTVIGAHLAVLIPILLYGAMRRPWPTLYFAMACLTLLGCFLSGSRTALGVGVLFFGIGILIGCFYGKRKTLFQITSLLIILFCIIALIGFFESIRNLFAMYFEKGFRSTSRWEIWKQCVDGFFDHPLFGAGFFGLELGKEISHFAHNTIMQMIGACGLYGIIAYFIYRIETIFLYLERPTLFKTMMGLSAASLVIASLLDIFLFSFCSMIYHSALLALTAILNREEGATPKPPQIMAKATEPSRKND
jgi:hypothetical protein